jgi:hypothetical protein
MRTSFETRNVVCIAPFPPPALDLRSLEEELGLSRPQSQISNPQLAMAQYEEFQIIVAGGRVQLEPAMTADNEVVRRALDYLLGMVEPFHPTAVGFNAAASVDSDDGQDPTAGIVQLERLAEHFHVENGRGGFKFAYLHDGARWTISVDPQEGADQIWVVTLNRHYDQLPSGSDRSELLDWFASLDDAFVSQVDSLLQQETVSGKHAS